MLKWPVVLQIAFLNDFCSFIIMKMARPGPTEMSHPQQWVLYCLCLQ